ncbi:MAG: hypothetical protein LBD27_01585 [Tannerella sp.]|jgi:hypothetical protein|nr:hypothetical protein [Tannerella sp.]
MRSYTELLNRETQKEHFSFTGFMQQLSSEQIYEFMEDVFSERTDDLWTAFPPSKNISTHDIVFLAMEGLDYSTYQNVKACLDKILESAITRNDSDSQHIIENVLALTGARKDGVSANCITNLLKESFVSDELKLSLAFLLSQIRNTVSLSYWDENFNFDEQPYLIPAYISAYAKANPEKALKILKGRPEPESLKYYRSPITTALENMLVTNGERRAYGSLYTEMPEWAKQMFEKILQTSRFGYVAAAAVAEDSPDLTEMGQVIVRNLIAAIKMYRITQQKSCLETSPMPILA